MPDKMLDKKTIRSLQGEAHHLKPELTIGKDGLNEALIKSIFEAFNTKELLKVKALDTCPNEREELREKLSALPEVSLIQNIGHTFILYKKLQEQAGGDGKNKRPKLSPREKAAASKEKAAASKKVLVKVIKTGGPKPRHS